MTETTIRAPALHSIDAEHSVLGCLMLDPRAFDRVADVLNRDDFYEDRHATIFDAMTALSVAGKPCDTITVFEELRRRGKAEYCGGLEYLGKVEAAAPSGARVRQHAEIVREYARQRAVAEAADQALHVATGREASAAKLERIAELFAPLQRQAVRSTPRVLAELLQGRVDRLAAAAEGERPEVWPTRIPTLDRMLNGGLRPGLVYVIAARPSVGKSSFAAQLAAVQAEAGRPTLFLSQEMPSAEVVDRTLARASSIDYGTLQNGSLADDQWGSIAGAIEEAAQLPLFIDDEPALTLHAIKAKARGIKGLKVLVLDYLQLCSGSGDNRNAEVEAISRALKALAKEMGIAVLALSQLNRAVEQRGVKRPMLSDLRDSGAIEQDADVVLFLWPVRKLGEERRIVGLGVDKNRQGRCGEFGLDFYGATHRWGESTADIAPDRGPARRGRDDDGL